MDDDADQVGDIPDAFPATMPELVASLAALPVPVFILRAVRDEGGTLEDLVCAYRNDAAAELDRRRAAAATGSGQVGRFPWVAIGTLDQFGAVLDGDGPLSADVPLPFEEDAPDCVYAMTVNRCGEVLLVVAREATGQRQAEAELAEVGQWYRMLAENASDFVALTGPDHLISWVSPAVTASTGWPPEDLIGTPVDDLIHPDDRGATAARRAELYSGRTSTPLDGGLLVRLRTTSDTWRWMSEMSTPVLDHDGRLLGVMASMKDVDDLVRTRERALADRAHLRATVDSLLDPHVLLTAVRDESGDLVDFTYADANPAACAYNRIDYADLIGARLLDVFTGHAGTELLAAYRRVVETGAPLSLDDVRYVHEILGTERRYDIRAARVADGISLTWRDVTSRHAAAEALARSQEQYRVLAENASDVVLRLDPDGTFAWVSDQITGLLGWRQADVVGREIADFIHPDDAARFREVDAETPVGHTARVDVRIRSADASYRWMACRIRVQRNDEGMPTGRVGALIDIADRKAAEEQLSYAASHDALTGLGNRALLLAETDRALAAGRRSGRATGLLLVDLDHFKNVNDALGHTVGDELLSAVGARIAATVRSTDLVARHGGDEFVVLQRDLHDVGDSRRLAERIVLESRKPLTVGDVELFATASVGVAVVIPGLDPVHDAADLIREADTAMYAAKVAGRDRVAMFSDDLKRSVDDRLHLEVELRHALARDELAVWYQPEVDLHDGTVRAAEALLRWHHPDGNLRRAAQFIEVAEDSGLILDIGAWALREACTAAAGWAARDPAHRLVLRVNLSPLELSQPGLVATLDEALTASGLRPDLLSVEITEMAMLSDSATVRTNLEAIRERGIELAIDDFGTGYGSLSYLRRYSIDVMKVDRSFVTGITTDSHDRKLVAGVVALAERLGISVTAEGVEHLGQARVLASMGCAGAQGYLYSAALPFEGFAEFLQTRASAELA
ncbi:MAG: EAL and GGDEF domain-containing protein [Cellulomonas sp.]